MLQSLQRGTAVLDAIASSPQRLSAKDLAARLQLDRTVVHRVLRTLEAEQFVDQADGRYGLGARTLLLGNSYLRHNPLRQASLPYQIDLLDRGFPGQPWAVSVLIPVGAEMTLVTQIWSPTAPLDSLFGVPARLAIDQTAAGRCILAALPPSEVVALVGPEAAAQLESRFEQIRAAEYVDFVAPNERGNAPMGLSALSALIRNPSGHPIAGLTLSGAALEAHINRDSPVAERLRRTARQIGQLVS
jgi:IclR family transcriptional regulator, KDG regulon repressor